MIVLVGKHSGNKLIQQNYLYYRFFIVTSNGIKQKFLKKKYKETTKEIYEAIFFHFLQNKQLTFICSDTFKKTKNGVEYTGLKLQNNEEEKLNIFFSQNSLDEMSKLEQTIKSIKMHDFYEYAILPIEKHMIEKLVLRSSDHKRSSIQYNLNSLRDDSFCIKKQLSYYYMKVDKRIDQSDLWLICTIIRYFINSNLKNNPYYEYKSNNLFIYCNAMVCIEIRDSDLVKEIEIARILDDLWLLNHALIDKMPLQEESIAKKEELKRKRIKYLERQN